jgi:hypothetical protein
MFKFIWEKVRVLVLDGKKEPFKFLTLINFNQNFIMIYSFIIAQLTHGWKASSKVIVFSINGLISEQISG